MPTRVISGSPTMIVSGPCGWSADGGGRCQRTGQADRCESGATQRRERAGGAMPPDHRGRRGRAARRCAHRAPLLSARRGGAARPRVLRHGRAATSPFAGRGTPSDPQLSRHALDQGRGILAGQCGGVEQLERFRVHSDVVRPRELLLPGERLDLHGVLVEPEPGQRHDRRCHCPGQHPKVDRRKPSEGHQPVQLP